MYRRFVFEGRVIPGYDIAPNRREFVRESETGMPIPYPLRNRQSALWKKDKTRAEYFERRCSGEYLLSPNSFFRPALFPFLVACPIYFLLPVSFFWLQILKLRSASK